jgi:hypothetical protein
MSIGRPQKHRATPLGRCVGSLQPASRMAYFHAVRARRLRYYSKSATEHFGRLFFPGDFEIGPCLLEGFGRAFDVPPVVRRWIKAALPSPLIDVDGSAGAERDRADMDIFVIDVPAIVDSGYRRRVSSGMPH